MGSTMTWDVNDRLTSISDASAGGNGGNIAYTYLSDGSRRSKMVNGVTTTYHYNNGLLLSQSTGDETLYFYYDSTGNVTSIGYKKGSADEAGYFFTRNAQGDIIGVYRSCDSKLIGTYDYDLWGRPVSVTEATAGIDTDGILTKNPFRYREYYYDQETGFYYLNARYYDPVVRRFISADSISYLGADETVTGFNLFVYCGNNPVMGFDPSGCFDWKGVAVGAAICAAGVITLATCGAGAPVAALVAMAAVTYTGAVTTYAAATDSAMVIDTSIAGGAGVGGKIGGSIVIDFAADEAYFYAHGGAAGNVSGVNASYSVGIVRNYEKPIDYAGEFYDVSVSAGPIQSGWDYCWSPNGNPLDATGAFSYTFSTPGVPSPSLIDWNTGYDFYLDPIKIASWR